MRTTRASAQKYNADLRRLGRATELFQKMKSGTLSRESFEKVIRKAVVPGLYEHWKSEAGGPKFYAVFGVVPDVEGQAEPVVAYTALYRPHAGQIVYRSLIDPTAGFLTAIDRHDDHWDYKGSRFVLERRLNQEQVGKLIQRAYSFAKYTGRGTVLKRVKKILDL